MANNASINWYKKINAVLATIGGEYGKLNDKKTYGVMLKAITDLLTPKGIGGDLAAQVIKNIEIRVGPLAIAHEGRIILKDYQRKYARKAGWGNLPSFETYYGCPAEPELKVLEVDGFSDENRALVEKFLANSDAVQKAALVEWIKSQNAPVEVLEEVATPVRATKAKPAHHADAMTIWVKENGGKVRASGNLDINGTKYCLNFTDFYSALDRIPETASSLSWRKLMAGEMANAILPVERNYEGVAARSTMSGLFAATDSRGYKAPVSDKAAVVLEWEGDTPVGACFIDGNDRHFVAIRREANDRFKGIVALAA